MEYLILMSILLTSLYTFKGPILRAIAGKWKSSGDQFGHGRQFNPADTVECAFDPIYTNRWYDVTCFDNHNCPPGNDSCIRLAILQCCSGGAGCRGTDDFCNHEEND